MIDRIGEDDFAMAGLRMDLHDGEQQQYRKQDETFHEVIPR